MDLYFLGSKNGSVVASGGNREQALRVGVQYFSDLFPDSEPPIITTCVRIDIPDNARVVAAAAS